MSEQQQNAVPFTILTGFLGAGKTTVLNRVLAYLASRDSQGVRSRRVAVLVNELGRISIDSKLILGGSGDILELAGGCLCCKVDIKNDLWDGIVDVIKRSQPDHVVLETTGIAEPQVIIDDLHERLSDQDSNVADRVFPAGVVCVVDPLALEDELARRDEVKLQIECADRFLMSKMDIATPEHTATTHRILAELRPEAERASFPKGEEKALTDWLLMPERHRRRGRASAHHHHGAQVTAVAFACEQPLVESLFRDVLNDLGPVLLRAKGFVELTGCDEPKIFEVAGGRLDVRKPEAGQESSNGHTEFVLIGEELDEAMIRRRLWACQAQGAPPATS